MNHESNTLLSSHVSLAGLVESQGLVPLILMSGTTFTQLSLLVTVECGPSQTHLLKSKDMIVKCKTYTTMYICVVHQYKIGGVNINSSWALEISLTWVLCAPCCIHAVPFSLDDLELSFCSDFIKQCTLL